MQGAVTRAGIADVINTIAAPSHTISFCRRQLISRLSEPVGIALHLISTAKPHQALARRTVHECGPFSDAWPPTSGPRL
jgi:hypothetical protein